MHTVSRQPQGHPGQELEYHYLEIVTFIEQKGHKMRVNPDAWERFYGTHQRYGFMI